MAKANKKNHHTSLRLPTSWHQLMEQIADDFGLSTSSLYRLALKEFIDKRSSGTGQQQ
jgi:hypothetical protein